MERGKKERKKKGTKEKGTGEIHTTMLSYRHNLPLLHTSCHHLLHQLHINSSGISELGLKDSKRETSGMLSDTRYWKTPREAGNMMWCDMISGCIPSISTMVYCGEWIGCSVRTEWRHREPDLYTWKQFIKCLLAICLKLASDLVRQQVITRSEAEDCSRGALLSDGELKSCSSAEGFVSNQETQNRKDLW